MKRTITAIDIGTTSISTIVAERQKDGGIRILGIGQSPTFGMRRGMVADIEDVTNSLKRSVKEAAKSSGISIRSAVIGIGGTHINTFSTRGVVAISRADGEISEEDVRRVNQAAENFIPKNPNREIVHIIPREYKIDSEGGIKDPVGMNGIRLEVDAIIVDGSKSATQSVVKCVKAAGIEIEDLVFSSLASAEAVLSRRQKELGVMLLDIGGGTSDFSVWEEGRLIHAGIFPVGGLHITQDLAVRLQTHIDVAEQVKIRYGHSIPDTLSKKKMVQFADFVEGPEGIDTTGSFSRRDVAEVVEARLKDVFELSAKELKKIDKAGLLPAGVVLIGGASRIPGIMELAKHELRLPIEIGSRVNLPTLEDKELQDLLFTYPVALGLVAWQINKTSGSERFFYNPALSGYTSTVKNWLRMFLP